MRARLSLFFRQQGRARLSPAFFRVNPRIQIEGFSPAWCREVGAILQYHRMEHGLNKRSISYSLDNESVPFTSNSQETLFRGFPISNLFLYRQPTDGGIYTIPASLTSNLSEQELFELHEYLKERNHEALTHLTGMTAFRSFTEDPAVAFAFALSKGYKDGAFAIEHWTNEGSVLVGDFYRHAAKLDYPQVEGLLYQKELAGPFLPFARQKCTSIFYKQDRVFNPDAGFNIISPFKVELNQFLLANGDEDAVRMIHEYDQKALRASMKFSDACRHLIEGQRHNFSDYEMRAAYERFCTSYQKVLEVEQQFRNQITCSIKNQAQRGNPLMEQIDIPADISLDDALRWYMSAICYSKGRFITPQENECSLNINREGNFILEWSRGSGSIISKTFAKEQALSIIPHIMLAPFNLISSDGQFDFSDDLAHPVKQMFATSFITQLKMRQDHDVENLLFQARDAHEVSRLCQSMMNDSVEEQLMRMGE